MIERQRGTGGAADRRGYIPLLVVSAVVTWGGMAEIHAQPASAQPAAPSKQPTERSEGEARGDDEASNQPGPAPGLAPANQAGISNTVVTVGPGASTAPWSQGVSVDARRAAYQAFVDANDRAQERLYASAIDLYQQAFDLWPNPAFAYNLAVAHLQLNHRLEAYASFEQAVAHGRAPLSGDRYELALQQLARLERELSFVEISCHEKGAQVVLDGKVLFIGPGKHRAVTLPGAHQVVATRGGLPPVVETTVLAPGEKAKLALTFEYPMIEIEEPYRRWQGAWKPYAVVAAGAALTLGAVSLDWHSSQLFRRHDRTVREACPLGCEFGTEPASVSDPRQRAERVQRYSIIGYVAGGTALATGIVLAYLGREQVRRRSVRVDPFSAAELAVLQGRQEFAESSDFITLWLGSGILGLSAGGTF